MELVLCFVWDLPCATRPAIWLSCSALTFGDRSLRVCTDLSCEGRPVVGSDEFGV